MLFLCVDFFFPKKFIGEKVLHELSVAVYEETCRL